MKFFKWLMPHLAAALLMGLAVLVILDSRNPLMAFLTSPSSHVYILLCCALGLGVIWSRIFGKKR